MTLKRRNFIVAVISSVAAAFGVASADLAEAPALAGGADGAAAQTAVSIPDFTDAIWAHPMLGFESPLSGPGPVVNTKRTRTGTSDSALLVGDYTNPILKPAAAEIVKKRGEISQSGVAFPDPDACACTNLYRISCGTLKFRFFRDPTKSPSSTTTIMSSDRCA
jgi:hypothetical protein